MHSAGSRNKANDLKLADRLTEPFVRFSEIEISSALLLLTVSVAALVWANLPGELGASYHHFWTTVLTVGVSHAGPGVLEGMFPVVSLTLEAWVNDALMAIFFFVVGMEIKRELAYGELAEIKKAMLPLLGALGGMIVPAGLYLAFHAGGPAAHGWGIPMATDIAFAVAVLSVFGKRVPLGLKVFLLALAIADDLGAVLVIALFYTEQIFLSALAGAFGVCVVIWFCNKAGFRSYLLYTVLGAFCWYAMLRSGVHATVAGVIIGLMTPSRSLAHPESVMTRVGRALETLRETVLEADDHGGHRRHEVLRKIQGASREVISPLDFLTNLLHPWVAFVIMPVFALANAGVHIDAEVLGNPQAVQVGIAVAVGLLLGKPIGITLFSFLAVKLGFANLPSKVQWKSLAAVGVIAGIGFTVALFVTALAFKDPAFTSGSKLGILGGSVLATLIGMVLLNMALPRSPENQ